MGALQQEVRQRTDRQMDRSGQQFTLGHQKVKFWKVLRLNSPTSWSSKETSRIKRSFECPGPRTLAGSSWYMVPTQEMNRRKKRSEVGGHQSKCKK